MSSIIVGGENEKKETFLGHVFCSTDEGKAEVLNVIQYGIYAFIPVIILNKLIQKYIPDADPDKSSLELFVEILIQIIVILCGIILIHRVITYFPTYSGFGYDHLALTNIILAFLIIVLSIQTKLGLKSNILVERVYELWNGPTTDGDKKKDVKNSLRVSKSSIVHTPSQADYLDDGSQQDMFPPAPTSTKIYERNAGAGGGQYQDYAPSGPMAANSVLGGSFGTFF